MPARPCYPSGGRAGLIVRESPDDDPEHIGLPHQQVNVPITLQFSPSVGTNHDLVTSLEFHGDDFSVFHQTRTHLYDLGTVADLPGVCWGDNQALLVRVYSFQEY